MNEFLKYYQREMEYQARLLLKYGDQYPELAENLELSVLGSDDPGVAKLLESAAFLNAGCQQTIESAFPDFTSQALDILYPELLSPIAPMGIIRFDLFPGEQEEVNIPAGYSVEATTTSPEKCTFNTIYPIELYPIEITEAIFESPLQYDNLPVHPQVQSILRIRLEKTGSDPLFDLTNKQLRLFISARSDIASILLNLMIPDCIELLVQGDDMDDPLSLPKGSVKSVGFGDKENIIPESNKERAPYRLLQEYFSFPQKFFFLDIENLGNYGENSLDLFFLPNSEPYFKVTKDNFQLGCTPVVNLFEKSCGVDVRRADPFSHFGRELEYPVKFSGVKKEMIELHSVQEVSDTIEFEAKDIVPSYGKEADLNQSGPLKGYWKIRRENSWEYGISGRENYLSFCDSNNKTVEPPAERFYLKTLCSNRDLSRKLIIRKALHTPEKIKGISGVHFQGKPTLSAYPMLSGEGMWQLISTLSLSYLSLIDNGTGEALDGLKNILEALDLKNEGRNKKLIRGIQLMTSEKTVDRFLQQGLKGWQRGLEMTLTFDPEYYTGSNAFLLGAILERFFPLYVPENSFTATVIKKTDSDDEWYRWPSRQGTIPII